MKKSAIILAVIMLFAMVFLSACNKDKNNNNKDTSQTVEDDFYTNGFTKDSIDATSVLADLVGSGMQSLKNISSEVVPGKSSKISVGIAGDVKFNDNDFNLLINANYDDKKPDESAINAEITSPENNSKIMGVYVYRHKQISKMYLEVAQTKVCFPIKTDELPWLLPLQLKFGTATGISIGSSLTSFFVINDDIKYEYKDGKTTDRHFRFSLNVPESLKRVVAMDASWQEYLGLNEAKLDFIFENLFNIKCSDIRNNNIPQISFVVEFRTSGGNADNVGLGGLSSVKVDIDVKKAEQSSNNTQKDLVFGDNFNLSINANKLVFSNISASDIIPENNLTGYLNYTEQIIDVNFVSLHSDMEDFNVDMYLKFDYDNNLNTNFMFSAKGVESGIEYSSIYYTGNFIYFNWLYDDNEINIQSEFDFKSFVADIISKIAINKEDFVDVIFYILGNLRMGSDGLSFTVVPESIYNIASLDSQILFDTIDKYATIDLVDTLNELNISTDDIGRIFSVFLEYDKPFITKASSIPFPNNPASLKK